MKILRHMMMKRLGFLMIMGLLFGLLAFTYLKSGMIRGRIAPADAASQVLAVLGKDTLRAEVNNGNFAFPSVKVGTYTIQVKAKSPYKDTSIVNVPVIDSVTTDIGLLKLKQE
ncbi:MAG: carboxypeptidase-like regulatory domain-containing protein [Candidatus Pedobacter colombiensis]|uniref:Carboxypeptidase-like regulatory domain-containing protein n=1 Tax=Candidatus Pedobacter colombiensis TaxID=3121371 RepID=A0AAJ6B725_9SPHI|nr:carboxypeptidase-like regulatory domain-containing protein [Pedobacter sp.]WEK19459.1 MAG: carboxypeptidase-like regulatory domain-containing protein [Pedobacter sp.]